MSDIYDKWAQAIVETAYYKAPLTGIMANYICVLKPHIAAELRKLIPIPKDLEKAVRVGIRYCIDTGFVDDRNRENLLGFRPELDVDAVVSIITSAVAPLLAEKDQRIEELESLQSGEKI